VLYAARPDVAAIVHTHSMYATALSILRQDLPALHYMIAAAGTDVIPCAPYATFGTAELADVVARSLGAGQACLMANHGQIAVGRDLAHALSVARDVETLAELSHLAQQIGRPVVLSRAEMDAVRERYREHGQPGRKP
jgi:L-fuculose-phosphate aldolase